ncbi:hypothetical protein ACWJJH_03215 [Endozoicomonadaceae bacterium StTr2]
MNKAACETWIARRVYTVRNLLALLILASLPVQAVVEYAAEYDISVNGNVIGKLSRASQPGSSTRLYLELFPAILTCSDNLETTSPRIPQKIPLCRLVGMYQAACNLLQQHNCVVTINIELSEDSQGPHKIQLGVTGSSACFEYDLDACMTSSSFCGQLPEAIARPQVLTNAMIATRPSTQSQASGNSSSEVTASKISTLVLLQQSVKEELDATPEGSYFLFGTQHQKLLNRCKMGQLGSGPVLCLFFNPMAANFEMKSADINTTSIDLLGQHLVYDANTRYFIIRDPQEISGSEIVHTFHINEKDMIDTINCYDSTGRHIAYSSTEQML